MSRYVTVETERISWLGEEENFGPQRAKNPKQAMIGVSFKVMSSP